MAHGNVITAEGQGVIQKGFELDLFVAQDIRIRRPAVAILIEKVLKDIVPVLGREVGLVQWDADLVAHRLGIGQIAHGRAVLRAVVLLPVFHKQALHVVTLLLQKQGGYRRIDAAGHANNHFGARRRGWRRMFYH